MTTPQARGACISFRITKELDQRIAEIAVNERRTKSDMIRVALEDWAVSYERKSVGSTL